MKKVSIKSGKYVVLKKDGIVLFSKKLDKNMKVEAPDNIEVFEKTTLTEEEKIK